MKYKKPKATILIWKRTLRRSKPKQNQLTDKIIKSKAAHLVHEFFLMEDEDPPPYAILSSVYYSEYSFHCLENEATPLSRRAFSILAQKYVISEKGKYGKMWYTLKPHILIQLNTKLKSQIAS